MTTDTSKDRYYINGTEIGGVYDATLKAGANREVEHRPMNSTATQYAPGRRNESLHTLVAYDQPDDAGQQALDFADRGRMTFVFRIDYADGSSETWTAFVLSTVKRGGKRNGQAIGTKTIQIRSTGRSSLS